MRTRFGDIESRLVDALGLDDRERAILCWLVRFTNAKKVSQIARGVGLPRTSTIDVLYRLEKRKLVMKIWMSNRYLWRYKIGLEIYKFDPKRRPKITGPWVEDV